MKRFLTTILALLYLGTSSGTSVHLHYCMGKLADLNLEHKESKICSGCGMEKNDGGDDGCCKDEHQFKKNSAEQKIVESFFYLVELIGTAVIPSYNELNDLQFSSITEENPISHAPPRSRPVAVYLLNRTFRI